MHHPRSRMAALAVLAIGVTACTPTPSPAPPVETSASKAPSASVSGSPSAKPVAASLTAPYRGGEVRVDLHPIETKDGLALLCADYTPTGYSSFPMMGSALARTPFDLGAGGIRLVDSAELKIYRVGLTGEDKAAATPARKMWPKGGAKEVGATITACGLYPAPPGPSIDVLVPFFGYATGVPVAPASDDSVDSAVAELGKPESLDVYPLTPFVWSYDNTSGVESGDQKSTVTLRSDVLFATDKYQLNAKAKAVVDQVADAIKAGAKNGQLTVTGHTDDVGTDAYNQTLSQRRAKSVADRLAAKLGKGFAITAVGKGEREPKIKKTTKAARAANRRVEITFAGKLTSTAKTGSIPKPVKGTATGSQTITFSRQDAKTTLKANPILRSGKLVAASFDLRAESGSVGQATSVFTNRSEQVDPLGARGLDAFDAISNRTVGITMMTPAGWQYPFMYSGPGFQGSGPTAAGDLIPGNGVGKVGETTRVTILWPDTGQSPATVEVPGMWRLTGIPIS